MEGEKYLHETVLYRLGISLICPAMWGSLQKYRAEEMVGPCLPVENDSVQLPGQEHGIAPYLTAARPQTGYPEHRNSAHG